MGVDQMGSFQPDFDEKNESSVQIIIIFIHFQLFSLTLTLYFVILFRDKKMIDYTILSDDNLAGLLQSGNNAVFKEIYQRYNKLLFLYAFKKLRNEEEAKDVVQDVFLWILKNRETLKLKTTLSGYLYKSVLNKVFDSFKHKGIIRQYIEKTDLAINIDSTETDYLIREKEITIIIEREIAAMPHRMREVYELKRKNYLTTKQIAEQLGISEHTVSTQIKNAMKHLKVKLGVVIYLLYILNL